MPFFMAWGTWRSCWPRWTCWIRTQQSCTLGVMVLVLKISVDRTASGHCCSQGTASLQCCCWTWRGGALLPIPSSMRSPPVHAVSSVVPVRNKLVAAVAQQPVRHLSIPDLAGCCLERNKKNRFCLVWIVIRLTKHLLWLQDHYLLCIFLSENITSSPTHLWKLMQGELICCTINS
jgi:hypothetical protein